MTRRPSYATLYPYTTLFRSRGGGRSILPSTIPCAPPAQEPGEPNALVDDRAPREADDRRGYRARDPPERARPGNGVDELLVQRSGRGETDFGDVLDEDLAPDPQHRHHTDHRDHAKHHRHRAHEEGAQALGCPGGAADQPATDVVDLDEQPHDPVHAEGHDDCDEDEDREFHEPTGRVDRAEGDEHDLG